MEKGKKNGKNGGTPSFLKKNFQKKKGKFKKPTPSLEFSKQENP